jgi:hypothetical protein
VRFSNDTLFGTFSSHKSFSSRDRETRTIRSRARSRNHTIFMAGVAGTNVLGLKLNKKPLLGPISELSVLPVVPSIPIKSTAKLPPGASTTLIAQPILTKSTTKARLFPRPSTAPPFQSAAERSTTKARLFPRPSTAPPFQSAAERSTTKARLFPRPSTAPPFQSAAEKSTTKARLFPRPSTAPPFQSTAGKSTTRLFPRPIRKKKPARVRTSRRSKLGNVFNLSYNVYNASPFCRKQKLTRKPRESFRASSKLKTNPFKEFL